MASPHAQTARTALAQLKELASNLDGWNFTSEKDGVKLYNKSVDSSPVAIVRGETSIEGHEYTPQQIASIATLPGARKIWDEKFDTSEIKAMYGNYESLFWCKVKTPWPISPRDMSATSLREISENECYVVMTSVQDEKIPDVSGCVRANLIISGWKIIKTDTGVNLTYITQVDLAGSIPTAFVKSVQQQVPLCAGLVVKYAKDHGYPPTTSNCTAEFKSENFDHAKREYTAKLEGVGACNWLISKKMYPAGVKVNIEGDAQQKITTSDNGDSVLSVEGITGPITIHITKS